MLSLILLLTESLVVFGQRTIVNIDFGWRQKLGFFPGGSSCPTFQYANGSQCMNLFHAASGDTSASDCVLAACDMGAAIWQWEEGSGCWVGGPTQISNYTCSSSASWVGGIAVAPSPALSSYDDSAWDVIDTPHDFEIEGQYASSNNGGLAFLPLNGSYYRKHFSVPSSWQGTYVELYIEGSLSLSTWYLNGQVILPLHTMGYTSVILRLDNVGLNFGGENLLVAFIDGTASTAWFYEGAGIGRHNFLISTSPIHITTHSLQTPAAITGAINTRATTADGLYADSATVSPTLLLTNTGSSAATATVTCSLVEAGVSTTTQPLAISGQGGVVNVSCPILSVQNAELWSLPRPFLHTLVVSVTVNGAVVDSTSTSIGIRSIDWNADSGLYLNSQPVKMRGFCNHESFAGVGAAIPDRVDLFRVQSMRGVGGNAWRTSHNAPEPTLLDMTDRLGIVVLDENRVFATQENCPGCSEAPEWPYASQVNYFADLIERDRNRASVIWWSACNEAGCGSTDAISPLAGLWTETVHALDASGRRSGANMGWKSPVSPSNMSRQLDVMGFSHVSSQTVASYHSQIPTQPLVMTECCSCETQRGEDADLQKEWLPSVYYSNENSGCVRGQTQASNAVVFDAGTFVWTLHDYVGEPGNWPHVSSSFGSYDLAGFVKAPVYLYRSWWLANVSTDDAGRPPIPNTTWFLHIAESWEAAFPENGTRTINVNTNSAAVQLLVNGVPFGSSLSVSYMTPAQFKGVQYAPGNITALGLDASGTTVISTSKRSWDTPASIVLTLDAPTLSSGTGSFVMADGQDVALVRATIVDAQGVVVHRGSLNVTFTVTAGPGYVWATGNGDPADQTPAHSPTKPTYHGLLRAIVRSNARATGSAAVRALEALVNTEAGVGPDSSTILQGSAAPPTSFTVTATAPGLPSAFLTIPLSVDPADTVLAVAARSVGSAYITE